MRFGRTLEKSIYKPWRDNYIDYAKLKKLLREDDSASNSPNRQSSDRWTEDDEGAFVDELVNVQLEQVHAFHKETYEKLGDQTAKCEARLDSIALADKGNDGEADKDAEGSNGKKPVPSEDEKKTILQDVLKQLDQITKETNELETYARINYAGFLKAAKKHDRKRGHAYRVRPLLQVRLAALPFNKEDYNPLLYRLSSMYNFIRQHLEGVEAHRGLSTSSTGPGKEEYVSHKFWVHPENLLEVKTVILRRLPVLVYNPQTSKVAEGTEPDPSITSIYFDNPAFNLYSKKVEHGEASSLRMRWYGQLKDRPEIFIEKKTVSEDDTSRESRFKTKEKYIQRFIEGEYKMEKQIEKLSNQAGADSPEAKHFKQSVDEIQDFIKSNDLQPVLRANYTRTAFQVPGDDRIRISLDTDLAFIREDAIDSGRPCRDPESWHRADIDDNELSYPFSSIRKGEVSRFPFALLEIKIRSSDRKRLEWVQDLMHSHLVRESPRFSKFVHGVAGLFEDYVNTFPFWLSEMETDIRRDPQQAFEEEQAKKRKERDDEFAVGSLVKSRPSQSYGAGDAIISPVGSPSAATIKARSPEDRRKSHLASVTSRSSAHMPKQDTETVEEPDEDETGVRNYGTTQPASTGSRLADLLPSFSTSKYATARRKGQLPPGVEEPAFWIKDSGPVKVEAKVWLANQRTFIKWQHVSVLLGSLGLGLYNAAGVDNDIARGLALVYTLVAVFTGAWGYGVYMWRQSLIYGRSGRDFDAITGPVVVCVGLIVALLLNFAFKYRAAMENRDHHHHHHHSSFANETMLLPHGGDLRFTLHTRLEPRVPERQNALPSQRTQQELGERETLDPKQADWCQKEAHCCQDSSASAKKKTLATPKRTPSAQEDTDSARENTPSAQINPAVTAMQPQIPRHGLDNSPLGALATELRRSIVELQLQNLRKVAIVPKSMLQGDDDDALDPNEPSLVFATKAALSKTCHALHTEYAEELESQVLKCNVPNLALHVCDFDFTPLTRELFSKFKDSHRAFFNARAGAITIHLRLTPSFFERVDGENGRVVWLAGRDLQRRGKKNGLIQWLEWRKAEEKAGRKVSVAYRLERNYEVEGVEDREALRQFMLLFDPLSRGEGDIGRIVQEIIRVFKVIKDKEDREAQEEQEDEEDEDLEAESEEESEEEEDSEVSE